MRQPKECSICRHQSKGFCGETQEKIKPSDWCALWERRLTKDYIKNVEGKAKAHHKTNTR